MDDKFCAHMSRVYLAQAKATAKRGWKITLLGWAAKRRSEYFEFAKRNRAPKKEQLSLF